MQNVAPKLSAHPGRGPLDRPGAGRAQRRGLRRPARPGPTTRSPAAAGATASSAAPPQTLESRHDLPARSRCRRHLHRPAAGRRGHRRDLAGQDVLHARGPVRRRAARHRQGLRRGRHRAGRRSTTCMHGTTVATNAILEGKGARVGLVDHPTASGRCCRSPARSCRAAWPAGSSGPSPSRWPRWRTPSRSAERIGATGRRGAPSSTRTSLRRSSQYLRRQRRRGAHRLADQLLRQRRARAADRASSPPRSCPASPSRCRSVILPEMREYERDADHGRQLLRAADGGALPGQPGRRTAGSAGVSARPARAALRRRADGGRQPPTAAPVNLLHVRPGRRRHRRAVGGQAARASRTCSPSTWAAPRPTSRWSQNGQAADAAARPRSATSTVRASSVDVRTVGAGGGSIAHVPELTQALRVGPQSAGADAGPGRLRQGRRRSRPSPTPTSCSATCRRACSAAR